MYVCMYVCMYEGVSKSFLTGRLEQLYRYFVSQSLVSFTTITLCDASQ
jgi:hypothetical protein